ncbi:hypothetical protein [Winogradskyella sp.]|uniref:hypothetical protein n=1 Tax=Winogradskyella sp. TaxID=1883156 RepID=UPI0025D09F57|nr:hypothetical protein [Winogradskyella sp.]
MRFLVLLIFVLSIFSCKNEEKAQVRNPFLVAKHSIGLINDSTQVKDLKKIFANDSILSYKEDDSFIGGINFIDIYEKNGNQLLSIYPTDSHDSTATLDFVILKDSRYKTEKGISNLSTYKDIMRAYTISEIDNLIDDIKIRVEEIDASFIIDKKELVTNFDFGKEIDSTQISDTAKVSRFIINF